MKKLFIHNLLFRLVCPFATGALVYLLILLINNNIEQLKETFLSQELYVCIGLAFLIQEYARMSLVFFAKSKYPSSILWKVLLQIISSIAVSILIVTLSMELYFGYFLGYSPNTQELMIFNGIFTFVALIYLMLYMGHHLLHTINTERLEEEIIEIQNLDSDFVAYKNEINIRLLFESLEALIILMKQDPDRAEEFTDRFSNIYRYSLSTNKKELVPFKVEFEKVYELIQLFADLPFRKVKIESSIDSQFLILPGSLLLIIERIIRSSIRAENHDLKIKMTEADAHIRIEYRHQEMLNESLSIFHFEDIKKQFSFYTDQSFDVIEENGFKLIQLPKLYFDESMHH